jgi:hypothetical protein
MSTAEIAIQLGLLLPMLVVLFVIPSAETRRHALVRIRRNRR